MSVEETDELLAAQRDLEAAAAKVAEVVSQQPAGVELERTDGLGDAAALKAEMERTTEDVDRAKRQMERASKRVTAEVERQMNTMRRDLEARMARMNEALAPVQKRIELMQEGIETLGLYLSAANGVVLVQDGERAGAQEPIIIRQMVLSMAEETTLFASAEVAFNASDVDEFDDWLREDFAHIEQIVPDRKGVVAVVPNWNERVRDDWRSREREDYITHFIVRNGNAVYRTTVKQFGAGEVMVPRAEEFTDYFFDTFMGKREPLKPGTKKYAAAMEASDKKGRHFLRIGLILQGLVDNSEVFAPLHPAGIDMLSDPSLHSEKVRIVEDFEGGLESGDEPFLTMQHRLNQQLRVGMRIIGIFSGYLWTNANDHDREYSSRGHSRVFPTGWNQPSPPSGFPLVIEERRPDGGLVCRFARGEIHDPNMWREDPDQPGWGWNGGMREAKRRASVTVYPRDGFILPYDLLDAATLERCLRSRRERKHYMDMVPLIKAAMFAKRGEEAAEAPFLEMLRGVCARENGEMPSERETYELGQWFKLKNRYHRPLVIRRQQDMAETEEADPYTTPLVNPETGQEEMAGAVRLIVAEHKRRIADRHRKVDAGVVKALRAEHPDALLIARPRRGGYLALLPAHPTENVWVHELEFSAKGELKDRSDWKLIGTDRPTRWTIAYEHARWADWNLAASERDHLRGPELEELTTRMLALVKAPQRPMLVSMRPATAERRSALIVWEWLPEDVEETARHQDDDELRYIAHERRWKREPDGSIKLALPGGIYGTHTHRWNVAYENLPWEGEYSKEYAQIVLWGPELVDEWRATSLLCKARRDRRNQNHKRAREWGQTIKKQWNGVRQQAALEAFVAETPDATIEEWNDHVERKRIPTWPGGWPYENSHHHPHGALGAVLDWHAENDLDAGGLTVAAAFEQALAGGMGTTFDGFRGSQLEIEIPEGTADLVIGELPSWEPNLRSEYDEEEQEPEDDGVTDLGDGIEVVGPEEDEPETDMFDELRDAFGGKL